MIPFLRLRATAVMAYIHLRLPISVHKIASHIPTTALQRGCKRFLSYGVRHAVVLGEQHGACRLSQTGRRQQNISSSHRPENGLGTTVRGAQAEQLQSVSETRLLSIPLPLPLLGLVAVADLAEGLEAPVQLIYLLTLLGFLAVGAYLVVRQVLIRRELEEAAKVLGERIRTNNANAEDCFELGVILLRKKLYTQATKNLEKAKKTWDGEPEELAQVHNALGYAYFNMERTDLAITEYQQAVKLQPGYVTAWNNLGDALEKGRKYNEALDSYKEALSYAPDNNVAQGRAAALQTKIERLGA